MSFTDAFISHNLLVFGVTGITRDTLVARGCSVYMPDITSYGDARLSALRRALQSTLSMMDEGQGIQIQWSVDSDYSDLIDPYREATGRAAEWAKWNRELLQSRYEDWQQRGYLRRERINVFFTAKLADLPSVDITPGVVNATLSSLSAGLAQKIASFRGVLPDARVAEMGDDELWLYCYRHLNRDAALTPDVWLLDGIDREASVAENCVQTTAHVVSKTPGYLYLNGRYHALFPVRRWPSETHPWVLHSLLQAVNRDFNITVNMVPLNSDKEVDKEDRIIKRLENMQAHGTGSPSDLAAIEIRRKKVSALQTGEITPMESLFVVRVWADTVEELNVRCAAIRSAMSVSGGMKYHEVSVPATVRSIYLNTMPGLTHGDASKFAIYAENTYMADLLPMITSFNGRMDDPEAVYIGPGGNLAGVKLFSSGTPQHAFVLGMSRSGKSVLMIDLLTQTEPYFGFTAIVEEGLSYGTYTQLCEEGASPIIVGPDSSYIFNPFDTQELPLTGEHLNAIAALLLKMVGSSGSDETDRTRIAMLGEYIQDLYDSSYEDWCELHPKEAENAQRDALATETWLARKMPKEAEYLEAFVEARDFAVANPPEWEKWRMQFSSAQVDDFAQNPATTRKCRDFVFSRMKAGSFPRLAALVEAIEANPIESHNPEECRKLATMLAGWTADRGAYGAFFDGASNFPKTGKIVHFELGKLGKGASALKECAGFLVAHWVRQHIVSLPRNIRKRVVFEEIARFLNVPGGEAIMAEFYAQLGKFSCWVCSVTQQYGQIKKLPIKASILGNSSLFFVLKQKDSEDLDDFGDIIGLPQAARERILRYVLPANQPKANRAAEFTLVCETENGTMCGSLRCLSTLPLIYASSSTGDEYEARRQTLAKYPSAMAGVRAEVAKILA